MPVVLTDEGSCQPFEPGATGVAIQAGALAHTRCQCLEIGLILVPLVVIVFASTTVLRPDGSEALFRHAEYTPLTGQGFTAPGGFR